MGNNWADAEFTGGDADEPPGRLSFPRAVLARSLAAYLCSAAAVANAASTDATLSALSLKYRDGPTVAVSPGFNAAMTSYTASTPARVTRIAIDCSTTRPARTTKH
ncbi:MAG: hypothetical protein OXQ29_23260 [Rhodospirillaceae bacterium]|nr:hypothetical protein [Rhodospirillaceae bacterium]